MLRVTAVTGRLCAQHTRRGIVHVTLVMGQHIPYMAWELKYEQTSRHDAAIELTLAATYGHTRELSWASIEHTILIRKGGEGRCVAFCLKLSARAQQSAAESAVEILAGDCCK
jgi:hypothetical protein